MRVAMTAMLRRAMSRMGDIYVLRILRVETKRMASRRKDDQRIVRTASNQAEV